MADLSLERFQFLPLICEMLLKVQVGDTQELLRLVRISHTTPLTPSKAQQIQEKLTSATEFVDGLAGSQLTSEQQTELLEGLQVLLERKCARLGAFKLQQDILRFSSGSPNGKSNGPADANGMDTS